MCLNPSDLLLISFHLSLRESSILASHCFLFIHSSCTKYLILIVIDKSRESGWNKDAMVVITSQFVVANSISLKYLICIQSSSLSFLLINLRRICRFFFLKFVFDLQAFVEFIWIRLPIGEIHTYFVKDFLDFFVKVFGTLCVLLSST